MQRMNSLATVPDCTIKFTIGQSQSEWSRTAIVFPGSILNHPESVFLDHSGDRKLPLQDEMWQMSGSTEKLVTINNWRVAGPKRPREDGVNTERPVSQ